MTILKSPPNKKRLETTAGTTLMSLRLVKYGFNFLIFPVPATIDTEIPGPAPVSDFLILF